MLIDWINKIFEFNVEKHEIKRKGGKPYFANAHTQIGVLHTTEGRGVENAWQTLNKNFSAPHFIVGEGRIVQCRPLNVQASALHGDPPFRANANAMIQIEMVGFTGGSLKTPTASWIPGDDVLKPVVAIMAWASANGIDIPLQVPFAGWLDDVSDCKLPWATNNARRLRAATGLWPSAKGWWMHMEVPGQGPSWHFDCGAMQRTKMIEMAKQLAGKTPPVVAEPTAPPVPQTPATTPATADTKGVVKSGDRGPKVKKIQQLLMKLGFLGPNQDDGIFGSKTLAAVRKFQRKQALRVDGIVGPATMLRLNTMQA